MKKTSYKDISESDLIKALREKREALRKINFGSAGSKTRNVKEGRNTRRDIARILTVINSK